MRTPYDYSPYGQRTVYTSPGTNDPDCHAPILISKRQSISSVKQPWGLCSVGFQGLMHDEETGNVYNRRRIWSPTLGRFHQRDPLGYPNGLNAYAGHHVLRGGLDPSGRVTVGTGANFSPSNLPSISMPQGSDSSCNECKKCENSDQAAQAFSDLHNPYQLMAKSGINPMSLGGGGVAGSGVPGLNLSFGPSDHEDAYMAIRRRAENEAYALAWIAQQKAYEKQLERNQLRSELGMASILCPPLILNVWAIDFIDGNYENIAIDLIVGAGIAKLVGSLGHALSSSDNFAGGVLVATGGKGPPIHHFYHGTTPGSTVALLNGQHLNVSMAAANHIDGPLGFYLATESSDAAFFAARRGTLSLLRFEMSNSTLCSLKNSGAVIQEIPIGISPVTFAGKELYIPPPAFSAFNHHLDIGDINVGLFNPE